MSHPIDVGSVLGGRYKVTATVLTSHDQDLVLDGVDQVLNRPVSILVAGPDNAEQVAQSAREVATGERPGTVQILDLGVSEATTYLITNHTSAADLLDLVVASNPPYVEPFFTDTLGSEIFGQARSHEPETVRRRRRTSTPATSTTETPPSQADPAGANQPAVPPARRPARRASGAVASSRGAAAAAGASAALPAELRRGSRRGGAGRRRSSAPAPQPSSPLRPDHAPSRSSGERGTGAACSASQSLRETEGLAVVDDDDYGNGPGRPGGCLRR